MNILDELKTDLAEIKKLLKEKVQPEEVLTTDEVAKLLKVNKSTVINLRNQGKLKAHGIKKMTRYFRSEVLAAMTQISGEAA